jgi:hypothetical protein
VHTGEAWGLLTNLLCAVTNPYNGLELIKVNSINDWRSPFGSSDDYGTNRTTVLQGIAIHRLGTPFSSTSINPLAFPYQYVMASDRDVEGGSDYVNSSTLPLAGSLELVMWQSYQGGLRPRCRFLQIYRRTLRWSPPSRPIDNATYLGYGIRLRVSIRCGVCRPRRRDPEPILNSPLIQPLQANSSPSWRQRG